MSIRLKLVSCISAFILVLGIFIFGVLSAEQATVNLGGSISFEATDVYARVTGRVQNAQDNPTLETLEFSAYNDTPDQSSWSGLELRFDSRATNITIEVTVENLSMERELTVNLTDMIQISTDNLGKSITLDNGAYVSGTNTTVPVATSNDENNTSKVTFVITFDVIDHNSSLPSTNFDYDINLMDESVAPEYEILEGFSFNENGVLLGYTGNELNVVIPSSYSIIESTEVKSLEFASYDDFNSWIPNNKQAFTSMLNFTVIVDGTSCGTYPDFFTMLTNNTVMTAMENAAQSIIFNYQENIFVVGQRYTVTSIGVSAFSGCSSLETITIPDSVTSIGDQAFWGCGSLTSITIPNSVTSIGIAAFHNCSSLETINIPEGVTSIYANTFSSCDSLTSITIPNSVTSIDTNAFRDCSSLETINIPEGVTSIGDRAFQACTSLTSITIPSSATTIGYSAFSGCTNLNNVTIESEDIYLDLTGQDACGYLINYVNAKGETVRVLKSVVDSVDSGFTKNTYLNGSNFARSEERDYYVYTHI